MKKRKINKLREFWLAIPPDEYDGGPGVWQTKDLAKRSYFPLGTGRRFKIAKPIEIVHVKEVRKK